MPEKKTKSDKPKIEIQTRKPEKRGIFAELGKDRQQNEHPLREILNFPAPETLNIQTNESEKFKSKNIGYPQNENLDIQLDNPGYPKDGQVDIQNNDPGYPITKTQDIQSTKSGYPKTKTLDSKISKTEIGISNEPTGLDSKISKKGKLDIPNEEKKADWQKYHNKRKSKGIFLRTDNEITKKFKQFCIEQDWDFSQGTEIAWNKLMNGLDIQKGTDLDSLISLDDRRLKMLYKTRPIIINLYLRYNSIFNELAESGGKKWTARWSPRDDESAHRYNEIPPAIVELGILQTQVQKGFGSSRIQTFKYYTDEIEKVLASGVSDEMLDTILKYHRQLWKNQTGREVDLEFLEDNS